MPDRNQTKSILGPVNTNSTDLNTPEITYKNHRLVSFYGSRMKYFD